MIYTRNDVAAYHTGDHIYLSDTINISLHIVFVKFKTPHPFPSFEECERAGRLILAYSKDLNILLYASEWLVKLYCEMGEKEKAIELSQMLPSVIGFNKEAALARICELENNYMKAAEYYTSNIVQFQKELVHSLILCGNMHVHKEKKKAVDLYSLAITFAETFLGSNPVPNNNSLQKTLTRSIDKCKKTIEYLNK